MRLLWHLTTIFVWLPWTVSAAGAMVMLVTARSEVPYVLSTIHSYQERFNEKYNNDWVIISYRSVIRNHRETIREIVRGSTVKFVDLKYLGDFLKYPEGTDTTKVRKLRNSTPLKSPWRRLYNSVYSRHFTRFSAGHFFNLDNIWLSYEYYWRVPVGSKLGCDVNYDVFQYMEDNNIKYGFLLIQKDNMAMHPSFLREVQKYVENPDNEMQPSPSKNNFNFLIESGEVTENNEWIYKSCNFDAESEIVSVDFFQSPQYKHFFNHIDLLKGMYYETWREAAIKTAAVSLFLPSEQVRFMDLPIISPMYGVFNCPSSPDTYIANRCTCDANIHQKAYKFGPLQMKAVQMLQSECLLHWTSLHSNN